MAGPGSFDDFFRVEQAGLVRYAALLTGSTAQGEDLVQEVLVRLYLRWHELAAPGGNVLAYARRAVTNEHISWRRRWSTRNIRAAGDDLPDTAVHDQEVAEADQVLLRRLHRLPARQRAAVVMRYYQDLTDGEIADALGCRPVTVRSYISRGLDALRVDYVLPIGGDLRGAVVDVRPGRVHNRPGSPGTDPAGEELR